MRTDNYINKIEILKRAKILAKESVIFKPYKISKLDKRILRDFDKVPAIKLASKLKCNRSYIYAVLNKFKDMLTEKEIKLREFCKDGGDLKKQFTPHNSV